MSEKTRLLTAEELWLLPGEGKWRELVRGEVVETMPPGGRHGSIALKLGSRLQLWAESGPGGYVAVESGYILRRDPDTVRGPDVSYVSAERVPESGVPEAFWELAPDLAVEVVSPDETAGEVRQKVREYLGAGTRVVWEIHPRTQEVVAHAPDGSARTYSGDDRLQSPDVLPGFSCTVSELFG